MTFTLDAQVAKVLAAATARSGPSESGAAVLYLHGGGMILGSVAIFDGPVSRYVARTGIPMLSLEYRLAPEHPTSRWGSWTSSVPHEYDAIAFDADVSRRAQSDRDRVLQSL